jgi:hypothetical protein
MKKYPLLILTYLFLEWQDMCFSERERPLPPKLAHKFYGTNSEKI